MDEATIDKIYSKLTSIEESLKNNNALRSDNIGLLLGALAKAQGSYKKLTPNESAAGGPFSNLEAILFAVKDALSSNGLAFYQYIELLDEGSGAALLKTILGHESGQWISSSARVVAGKTDRMTGNTYEIHKRLQALMILGIAPSKNDPIAFDDNGEEQVENNIIENTKRPVATKNLDHNDVISKERYNDLLKELEGYEDIAKGILETYNIETLADLPSEVYHDALRRIRRIKKNLEEYNNSKK